MGDRIIASTGRRPSPYQVVDGEQDHRSDYRADEAGRLIGAIPTDGLAEVGCDESADNSQQRRYDETAGVTAGGNQLGRHTGQKSDDNRPDDMHDIHREDV